MECSLLVVTCPDPGTAESIARRLVEERLAACGNVTTPVTSIYRWKGEVHREPEVVLLVKTRKSLVRECVARIRSTHPYEVPEIIALPITGGLPGYLDWVGKETERPARSRGPGRN
jgi:periplasmic divalent cation tolerance protein